MDQVDLEAQGLVEPPEIHKVVVVFQMIDNCCQNHQDQDQGLAFPPELVSLLLISIINYTANNFTNFTHILFESHVVVQYSQCQLMYECVLHCRLFCWNTAYPTLKPHF